MRAFIFDLDGTLIDSKLDLVASVNAMLRETGRADLPVETVSGYIGYGAPKLIASALGADANEQERGEALRIFLAHYAEHKLDRTRTYPGVKEALEKLKDHPLAVLTNKPAAISVEILEGLELAKYFRVICGGDSFERKKPDPEGAQTILHNLSVPAHEAAMVGDSEVDVQTARNAGMLAVSVNYGFGTHDRSAHPADIYMDDLTELVALTGNHRG
jgi:phosphoglycolate phosphatase